MTSKNSMTQGFSRQSRAIPSPGRRRRLGLQRLESRRLLAGPDSVGEGEEPSLFDFGDAPDSYQTPRDIELTLPSGTVTLVADAADLTMRIATTELSRAPATSILSYDIMGAESSHVLVSDFTQGDPLPAGGMTYDGGDRVKTVRIVGDQSRLNTSTDGNVRLQRIDVIDLGASDAVTFILDSDSLRRIGRDDR